MGIARNQEFACGYISDIIAILVKWRAVPGFTGVAD